MAHIGLRCPAFAGHLNTMLPLGQELQRRGHRVTLFGIPDAGPRTVAAGLAFCPVGAGEFPLGTMAEVFAQLGILSGVAALRFTVRWLEKSAAVFLEQAPAAMKGEKVETLLVDQASPEGGTIAEMADIPFITVCSAVVLHKDEYIPPFNTAWPYSSARWARLRNRAGYFLLERAVEPVRSVVADSRKRWKLPLHRNYNDYYSPLAQLSQQPPELEFPRTTLPPWFHFTGPYHDSVSREPIPFPFDRLTGQPLIYASMGTVLNRLLWVFRVIAKACVGLEAQLVVSLGGGARPEWLTDLPGSPLIVANAPQLELLRRASLTITHAGMNTTLESLANGVPIVAIPVTNDQPGVAARVAWAGAGVTLSVRRLSVRRLQAAVKRVLTERSYREKARILQVAIRRSGGVARAAEIIEQVAATGKPVYREVQRSFYGEAVSS